nr:hypothetical protein [Tanacetum cinerariifolium]
MFPRVITPLFENMLVPAAEEVGQAQDDVSIPAKPSTSKPHKKHKSNKQQPIAPKVPSPEPSPEHQLPSPSNDPILDADKDREESFKQGRMIVDMDEDVEVNLEETQAKAYNLDLQHSEKVLSMQDIDEEEPAKVEEVLEVVTTAKLMIEVVSTAKPTNTAAAQVPKASAPRKRRDQMKRSDRQNNKVIRHQDLKRKPLTKAQARKNMMIYLKNMVGFKMNFFKGMTYSKIRPLFEKQYNSIQAFLEKVEEDVTVQEKEIEEEGNKRQATPLASKVLVVDYQIHHENNKPYYKIIKADGTHKLFLSFITLLKNFNREDLKTLWTLVKERFETTEPKNFSDDFLLNILRIMFEKPNIEANMFLLVEKKYPLTHFTLEQMLNNVRLEVKEKYEMSLELLSNRSFLAFCVKSVRSTTPLEKCCEMRKLDIMSYHAHGACLRP